MKKIEDNIYIRHLCSVIEDFLKLFEKIYQKMTCFKNTNLKNNSITKIN